MSSKHYDIAVIGGGIIGLATAMTLTHKFPNVNVVVLEKESRVAQHQTGHNSGVIHAGIYYPPRSQKASFCNIGARALKKFCDLKRIDYEMCGKLIVATNDDEIPQLENLFRQGLINGVEGLEMIDKERLKEIEPHAVGVRALLSPQTGIVDYGKISEAYVSEIVENGGDILTNTKLHGIVRSDGKLYLETVRGELSAKFLINCAGLYADRVAGMMGVDTGIRIIPFRGEYFSLTPGSAHFVNGLIYPVPDPRFPFLGVHFTKKITGGVETGPNAVLALAREGYQKASIDFGDILKMFSHPSFWRMAQKYWKMGLQEQYRSIVKSVFVRSLQTLVPEIREQDLQEPGAGVRAQAVDRKGRLIQDFNIAATQSAIHVLNAPSPGATASLAIGQHIVSVARESFHLEV